MASNTIARHGVKPRQSSADVAQMMREHIEADALETRNIKQCLTMFLNYHKTLLNCLKFVPASIIKVGFANDVVFAR